MSPEQAQSFPDIDGRTDLFSVGAMLYEMLTGEPPHSAPTYEAVLIAICTRDAADVRVKAPEVPEKLAQVIARALKRERDERYASAGDMLADLEATLRESRQLATKTRSSATAFTDSGPKSAGAERYRTLVFAVVAALGGFSVAAYFVARGEAPSQPLVAPLASSRELAPHPSAFVAEGPVTSAAPTPSAAEKPPLKLAQGKAHDGAKSASKKPAPAPSAGVAGGLGLSTREP
jgi:serine/threonine protein kinase